MKGSAIALGHGLLALFRNTIARLLRPTVLTQEEIEAISGKGGTPTYFAAIRER